MTCLDALRTPTAPGDAAPKAPGPGRRVLAAALATALLGTLAGCASPPAAQSELATMRERIRSHYLRALSDAELDAPTPQALAKALDRHSAYYSASDLAELNQPQDETGAAIQVGLDPRHDEARLVTYIGGAADEAGVRTGDLLLSVDGEPVAGLATAAILARLRGNAGSNVDLVVLRPGVAEPIALTLQRRAGLLPAVRITRPAADLLAVRICPFNDGALKAAAEALEAQWQTAPPRGLVLDLRRCGGGLLAETIGVSAMFLPAGTPVGSTAGRSPESRQAFKAERDAYTRRGPDPLAKLPGAMRSLPLVVLVDEGTAAGAEFVAAALREQRGVPLLGRTSFGKGSVQTVFGLPGGGAVKLTTAEWRTPAGRSLEGRGLVPDTVLPGADTRGEMAAAVAALRQ